MIYLTIDGHCPTEEEQRDLDDACLIGLEPLHDAFMVLSKVLAEDHGVDAVILDDARLVLEKVANQLAKGMARSVLKEHGIDGTVSVIFYDQ